MNHIEKYYNEVYAGKWLNLDEQLAFDKIANLWVKTSNKMEILDMGCGAGSISMSLAQEGHNVYGLDIMRVAVDRARRKGLKAEVCDLNDRLPFDDNTFDCVLALDVIEHLFSPLEVLKDIHRVLKYDGYLIIFIPLHFDIRQRFRIGLGKGIVLYEHLYYGQKAYAWDYTHIRFFTLAEVKKLISLSNFKVEENDFRVMYLIDLNPIILRFWNKYKWRLTRRFPSLFANGVAFRLEKK